MFRFLILGLLRNGARMHGYALVKEYRERSGIEVSTGNFYRELQRLVVDGLIRSTANPPEADARRTPYRSPSVGVVGRSTNGSPLPTRPAASSPRTICRRARCSWATPTRGRPRRCSSTWKRTSGSPARPWSARARSCSPGRRTPERLDVLPLLLTRRLKRLAADLEFRRGLRDALRRVAGARAVPSARHRVGAKDARARKLVIAPHTTLALMRARRLRRRRCALSVERCAFRPRPSRRGPLERGGEAAP